MIDLYTWKTPNGRKVSIMLEEIGESYQVHPIDITRDEQHAPEFLKISPNNKIPAIVDRDHGNAIMESGAILLYLAEKSGKLMPTDSPRWDVMQWLMWQMGGLGPMLGQAHHFLHFNPDASEYASTRFRRETRRLYGVLERRLAEFEYLSDSYSIADVATWPWIARFRWHPIELNQFPNVRRWDCEIASRPAVGRGYDVPATGEAVPFPD